MENANGSNKPVMQHPGSHLSAASSSDSSLELNTHPTDQNATLSSSQTPQWSMISNSPRGETGNPFSLDAFPQNLEPTKSPQSHRIDHPPGYDPNRIPKSIFSSKPTTPEWSTASNESLFSIQMGTNSFSTDYAYLVAKSGELNKPEEWKNSPSNPYYASEVNSNDNKSLSSAPPPPVEVTRDDDRKNARALESPAIQGKDVETPKMVKEKTPNITEEPPVPTTSNRSHDKVVHPTEAAHMSSPARASSPCHSEASGNSSSSFAFPVLVNDGATKSNSLKGVSGKVEKPQPQPELQPEKQPQQQQQQSESQPKSGAKSWCSCFTCWPRCC